MVALYWTGWTPASKSPNARPQTERRVERGEGQNKQVYGGELTDADPTSIEGKHDELLGKPQKKLAKSKQEMQQFIANL